MLHRFFVWIDSLDLTARSKYTAAIRLLAVILGSVGGAAWLMLQGYCFGSLDWLVCFTGYPAFSAVFIVFGFSCRNCFHDGKPL